MGNHFFFIMDIGRFIHYKIDIKVIDKEHSGIINKFQECFINIEEKKDISDVLEYIYKILINHFKHEEEFMVMINYPYSTAHTEEHKKLAFYFRKNIDRSFENKTQNRFLVSLLQEEFLKHIDYQDRQIETFYCENN